MEFLLKYWSGDQKLLHKSERGDEASIKYMRMSSTPSPQLINDPYLSSITQLPKTRQFECLQHLFILIYQQALTTV